MATPNYTKGFDTRTPLQNYTVGCTGTATIDALVSTAITFDQAFAQAPYVIGAVLEGSTFNTPIAVTCSTSTLTVTYHNMTASGITAGSTVNVRVTVIGELGTPA